MELIWAVTGGGAFSNANHLLYFKEERHDRNKNRDDANDTPLRGLVGYLLGTNQCLLLWSKNTVAWLNVHGTMVSGTVLSAMKSYDFLCARYNVTALNLQSHCDQCSTTFEVRHRISCSKGGLVIVHHN